MANHEFLRQLGLFTVPGFLTEEECARWREVADVAPGSAARVYAEGDARLDEAKRKSLNVPVPDTDREDIEEKIKALRVDIGRHFGEKLGGLDQIRCLVYGPGDFFALHADSAPVDEGKFSYLGKRSISVAIFLNEPKHPTAPYEGGDLSFYGLLDVPNKAQFGFPVDAETGLLVSFPAELPHEVSEITQGKRYSMVVWFFEKERIGEEDADHDDVDLEA
jgi:predicted 2-oxoglutarate/Fe(II)-dependent dioxygenase YbiX